ncbi:MAG: PepSY domain-containing protein [Deltaproteobacteria bacterium]|nr:PepSY domain-containing protein [Deltaproteobacteria bacterium]
MKRRLFLLIATITLLFPTSSLLGEEKGSILPLSDILTLATTKVPGKVIKAELKQGLYEVNIITKEGKEEKVYIDAIEGKVIEKAGLSLDEATKVALERVPGEVIKVEFERGKYEFKIRTSKGEKKEVYIDSRSGKVLKVENDDY